MQYLFPKELNETEVHFTCQKYAVLLFLTADGSMLERQTENTLLA